MAETSSSSRGDGPHLEVLRVTRLCHPNWENLSRLTFQPQSLEPSWLVWREEIFLSILFPRLQAMRLACTAGHRDELLAGDRALDESLPAEMADAQSARRTIADECVSRAAGGEVVAALWRAGGFRRNVRPSLRGSCGESRCFSCRAVPAGGGLCFPRSPGMDWEKQALRNGWR